MRTTLASTGMYDYDFYAMPAHLRQMIELAHQLRDAWDTAESVERDATTHNDGWQMDAKAINYQTFQLWQQVEVMGAPLLAAYTQSVEQESVALHEIV